MVAKTSTITKESGLLLREWMKSSISVIHRIAYFLIETLNKECTQKLSEKVHFFCLYFPLPTINGLRLTKINQKDLDEK